ncbi:MAG: hypothetical protein IT431_18005 [Phycisphaerales bacterium]|nr:hypothetical protein [Phycisphaerales bacterium]
MPSQNAQRSLRRAIRLVAVHAPRTAGGAGGDWPDPRAAACNRRCLHASTNEFYTDIMLADADAARPRLRLCSDGGGQRAQELLHASADRWC